ncbi:MAG TPA: c-type cytochrome biogenesis protein CcmI [Alphaproteobacteria bacterium]|nr:c-type cytochrome biogenesis protein CcmI [Alphaproteobacteria bacterium]
MIWLVLVLLTIVSVWVLLRPLLRRSQAAPEPHAFDVAIYRDQLAELGREVVAGVIAPGEAREAEREISRRLLAAATQREGAKATPEETGRAARRWAAFAIAALLPLAAFAFYLVVGAPGVPDFPLARRDATMRAMGMPDLNTAIARLEARLRAHPDDLEAWLLMARTDGALGRYEAAASAYGKAVALSSRRPDIVDAYAEALVMQGGGIVTEDARRLFAEVHAKLPQDPRARFYIGLAKAQSGDGAGAIRDWLALEAEALADAPWLTALRRQIDETAAEFKLDPHKLAPSQAPAPQSPSPATAAPRD